MPELPDIIAYLDGLERTVVGRSITEVQVRSPFVLRSFEPPVEALAGRSVSGTRRLGKRIVVVTSQAGGKTPIFVVIHLMIAGRLRWSPKGRIRSATRIDLLSLGFDHGTLTLTEASRKKRASVHLVTSKNELAEHDPGGLEPMTATPEAFVAALRSENRTLKRILTQPRLFSGIGNAYSDEILHAAGLSPVQLTGRLTDDEADRLYAATRDVLGAWIKRQRARFANRFPGPGEITAFQKEFAVHGRFGEPCPVCRTSIQRIRYADRETNYCPRCQTGGKVLADRSLSRLLKDDWPRRVEDWEN